MINFFILNDKDKIGIENENSKLKIKLDEIEIKKDDYLINIMIM